MNKREAVRCLKDIKDDIGSHYYAGLWHYEIPLLEIVKMLEEQPDQKRGHWITDTKTYTERIYCSECNKLAPLEIKSHDYYGYSSYGEWTKTNYCPNCGAKMDGEEEQND